MSDYYEKRQVILFSTSKLISEFWYFAVSDLCKLRIVSTFTDLNSVLDSYSVLLLVFVEYSLSQEYQKVFNYIKTKKSRNPHIVVNYLNLNLFLSNDITDFENIVAFPLSCKKLQQIIIRYFSDICIESSVNFDKETEIKGFEAIVGKSPALIKTKRYLKIISENNHPVLLLGKSGTGKTLAANLIHKNSYRRNKNLKIINMASIPESLAESELFGTVKGAYTGATNRTGCFGLANGGSLFLDEIGEVSLSVQGKLLRVLDNGIYRQVGSDVEKNTDVRLICATNANISRMMRKKNFRSDLYHRIAVFPVFFPSLKDRKSDIPLIAEEFLKTEKKILSKGALLKLFDYDWPGNIRQLRNWLYRACLLSKNEYIYPENIIFDL